MNSSQHRTDQHLVGQSMVQHSCTSMVPISAFLGVAEGLSRNRRVHFTCRGLLDKQVRKYLIFLRDEADELRLCSSGYATSGREVSVNPLNSCIPSLAAAWVQCSKQVPCLDWLCCVTFPHYPRHSGTMRNVSPRKDRCRHRAFISFPYGSNFVHPD